MNQLGCIAFCALVLLQAEDKALKDRHAEILAFVKTAKSERDYRAAIGDLAKLGEQAFNLNKYELSAKLYSDAEKFARAGVKDLPLAQSLQEAGKKAVDVGKEFSKASKALASILRNEGTPEDFTTSGKFLCFVKGDWELGIADLAKGKDEALKKLAEDDLAGANAVALGDAWGAHTRKDPAAKDRAIHWYGKAWPTLTGIDKEKVRDRLMKIYGPPAPPKTGMLPAGWRGSVSVDMKIDVLNGRTHSGSLAARLTPKGKGGLYDVMGAPLTPAKPGQKCEFSAWVFSDGTDGGGDIIQIQAQDASGKIIALKQPLIQPDTPIWTRLSWSLELPANTTHIGMAILLNSTKGFVWVDDVSIQLDGLEALRSGTFEPQ
jgi:hypothetical protein